MLKTGLFKGQQERNPGGNPKDNGKETSKDRKHIYIYILCSMYFERPSVREEVLAASSTISTTKGNREKKKIPFFSPKREDTRKETEKGYIKGKAPYSTSPSGKSNEPVCTHVLKEQSQKECNCVLNGGPTTTFSIRSILRKLGWTPAKTQFSVRYRRNAERHFRTRERKGPSQGLIQRGPRNDRNPKALANEDLHRQWTQHCENSHEQQRGNGTQLFTKSAGRIQKTRIRFSKAKTVTGAFSRTGIRH